MATNGGTSAGKIARGVFGGLAMFVIVLIAIFAIPSIVKGFNAAKSRSTTTTTESIDVSEFVAQCVVVSFDELVRNPEEYSGQKLKVYGKITQIQEYDGLDMAMLHEDFDQNKIYLTERWEISFIQPENGRILIDDLVTFYGTFKGVVGKDSRGGETLGLDVVTFEIG